MAERSTLQVARAEESAPGAGSTVTLPWPLSMLIACCEQQRGPLVLHDMVQALIDLELQPRDLRPFVRFVDEDYYRHEIYACPHFELRCLWWRAGQRSAVHDHGVSHCAVRVIEDVMTNTEFSEAGAGGLCATRRSEIPAGGVVATPANELHQAGNEQAPGGRLVTLHLYSPPLDNRDAAQEGGA